MTITKAAKEYAVPRLESAVDYAGPKVEAAVDYATPKLEAARDVAVAKAAEAMERLTPHAEALRDRLAERAAGTTTEVGKRGRGAAAALAGKTPRKRRTLLWSLLGVIGGIGAGLFASRVRQQAEVTPAWTNYGSDSAPVDATADLETAPAVDAPHAARVS